VAFNLLPMYNTRTQVSARAGNYAGYIGGLMDGNGATTYVPPAYWLNTGTTYDQVKDASNTGQFWDVNEIPISLAITSLAA
jgi:hypothetical protein